MRIPTTSLHLYAYSTCAYCLRSTNCVCRRRHISLVQSSVTMYTHTSRDSVSYISTGGALDTSTRWVHSFYHQHVRRQWSILISSSTRSHLACHVLVVPDSHVLSRDSNARLSYSSFTCEPSIFAYSRIHVL